jgi:hypothetical protein
MAVTIEIETHKDTPLLGFHLRRGVQCAKVNAFISRMALNS